MSVICMKLFVKLHKHLLINCIENNGIFAPHDYHMSHTRDAPIYPRLSLNQMHNTLHVYNSFDLYFLGNMVREFKSTWCQEC